MLGIGGNGEDGGGGGENESTTTLPNQVVDLKIQEKVKDINISVRKVNEEGWNVKLLSDNPSLANIETIDEDLQRLYSKVSKNREEDKAERFKIINARQSVKELEEIYTTYESISKPSSDN